MYLPILTYHRLLAEEPSKTADPHRISVSQSQFREHLAWFKRLGYHTLSLEAYTRGLHQGHNPPPRSFAITFDDGYEEVLTLGLPVLREFGFSATVFAVPGMAVNAWDDGRARLLTAAQMRELDRSGVRIEAHTSHHVHLTRAGTALVKHEIADSKSRLEEILGRPVTLFAYPYGATNDDVDRYVAEAGYEAAFATDRAPRDHAENLYRLRRVVVFPRNNVWEILWKVQKWYPAYQDWKRRRAGEGGSG